MSYNLKSHLFAGFTSCVCVLSGGALIAHAVTNHIPMHPISIALAGGLVIFGSIAVMLETALLIAE